MRFILLLQLPRVMNFLNASFEPPSAEFLEVVELAPEEHYDNDERYVPSLFLGDARTRLRIGHEGYHFDAQYNQSCTTHGRTTARLCAPTFPIS